MAENWNRHLEDTGYDCDHCGGEIFLNRDTTKARHTRDFYLCHSCGCEWTLKGDVRQVGTGSDCRAYQQKRSKPVSMSDLLEVSAWRRGALIFGGIILLLLLIRFGGLLALRLLLPYVVIGLLIYLVFKWGRDQGRW